MLLQNWRNLVSLQIGASVIKNWSRFILLQIGASVITNWGSLIITNQGKFYYKSRELLQVRATVITNWASYYKLGHNRYNINDEKSKHNHQKSFMKLN